MSFVPQKRNGRVGDRSVVRASKCMQRQHRGRLSFTLTQFPSLKSQVHPSHIAQPRFVPWRHQKKEAGPSVWILYTWTVRRGRGGSRVQTRTPKHGARTQHPSAASMGARNSGGFLWALIKGHCGPGMEAVGGLRWPGVQLGAGQEA